VRASLGSHDTASTADASFVEILRLLELPISSDPASVRGLTVGTLGLDSLGIMRVMTRLREYVGAGEAPLPFTAAQLGSMTLGELAEVVEAQVCVKTSCPF